MFTVNCMHMKIRYSLLALFVLLIGCSEALPQKPANRPSVKPTQAAKPAAARRIPNYQIKIKIPEGGKYYVSIISPDQNGQLLASELAALITDLPTGADRFNQANTEFPKVLVEADPNISMLDLWNPITLFRQGRTHINVYIPTDVPRGPGDVLLTVPWESPEPEVNIRPHPLFLLVALADDDKLSLNNEPAGTLSDAGPLTKRLLAIFNEREVNGIFREGTNEIEKSVSIVMPMSSRKFSDLVAIARAVWLSGGDRISLIMDNPSAYLLDVRKELLDVPPIPRKKKP